MKGGREGGWKEGRKEGRRKICSLINQKIMDQIPSKSIRAEH